MAYQTSLQAQTMELLVAYRQQPSVRLRNRLVRMNMGLVRKIAHQLAQQCAENYEDLEQCGYLGLISAIERFDPSRGHAFSSFAVPYIRGDILHFLRDRAHTVRMPRRWEQLLRESQIRQRQLREELGRQPSDQEMASALGLSMHEWGAVQLAASNRIPLSLNNRIHQSDSLTTLEESLVDWRNQLQQLDKEDHGELLQALEKIEAKAREGIQLVFFNQLSRKEAAQQMGVNPITVTRRINQGLIELKHLLQQPELEHST